MNFFDNLDSKSLYEANQALIKQDKQAENSPYKYGWGYVDLSKAKPMKYLFDQLLANDRLAPHPIGMTSARIRLLDGVDCQAKRGGVKDYVTCRGHSSKYFYELEEITDESWVERLSYSEDRNNDKPLKVNWFQANDKPQIADDFVHSLGEKASNHGIITTVASVAMGAVALYLLYRGSMALYNRFSGHQRRRLD